MPRAVLEWLHAPEIADKIILLGNWDGLIPIPEISFEKSETYLEGKNKELFLQFMRKMLCWVPEERKTAKELLQDPWLSGASE